MKQFFSNMEFMLKRMKKSVKGFHLSILLEVIFAIAVSWASLYLTQVIINSVTMKTEVVSYIKNVLLGVSIVLLLRCAHIFFERKNDYLGALLRIKELPVPNYEWMIQDYQFFNDKGYKELAEKAIDIMSSDSSSFQTMPAHLEKFLEDLLKIAFFSMLLSVLDQRFILLIIAILILVTLYRFFQRKEIKKKTDVYYKYYAQYRYITRSTKNFNIAKDIRLYQVKGWFEKIFDDVVRKMNKINFQRGLIVLGGQVLSGGLILLLTGYGYYTLINRLVIKDINLGQLMFYIGALTTLAQSSTQLINSFFDLVEDNDQIGDYRHFLDYPQIFNHKKGLELPTEINSIEFKNVSFKYPQSETKLFDNFNLTITKNQKIALVGLNGAGKTTLIKLLCNLYKPDSGQILINGIDNQEFNVTNYYQLFSVVFQDQLKLPFTLKDTIVQQSDYQKQKYQTIIQQAHLEEVIDSLPLKDETVLVKGIVENGYDLSGGQQQKVKLAQALYKDAPILILDEPTSALDPLAESEVYQQYYKFSQNKLSLFITHRLATTHFCERILYLENGKIIEDGSHAELMNHQGKYYQMYEKQAYYYQKEVKESE